MKRISAAIALIAMGAAGVAMAQTSPSQSAPPPSSQSQYPAQSQYPTSTGQSSSSDSAAQASKDAKKQQMKDCMQKEENNGANAGMSKHQIKEKCKAEIKNNSNPQG
jgi:hypothetical protein